MNCDIDIIVLAAGKSARMGRKNKLTLPFEKTTIIEKVLETITPIQANKKIVVTGYEAEKLRKVINPTTFRLVHNSDFSSGMSRSIQEGIKALDQNSIGAMIIPGDMPYIDKDNINHLIDHFNNNIVKNKEIIVVPTENEIQKNPVIFSSYYYPLLLESIEPNGFKKIVQSHSKHVLELSISNTFFFKDIDTVENYQAILSEATG